MWNQTTLLNFLYPLLPKDTAVITIIFMLNCITADFITNKLQIENNWFNKIHYLPNGEIKVINQSTPILHFVYIKEFWKRLNLLFMFTTILWRLIFGTILFFLLQYKTKDVWTTELYSSDPVLRLWGRFTTPLSYYLTKQFSRVLSTLNRSCLLFLFY